MLYALPYLIQVLIQPLCVRKFSSLSTLNESLKAMVIRATKTSSLSRNIAAKLVEKRCCAFYTPTRNLSCNKKMCCKLLQRVAESRTNLYFLQQNQHFFFLFRDRLCVGCKTHNIAFRLLSFAAILRDKLDAFVARILHLYVPAFGKVPFWLVAVSA